MFGQISQTDVDVYLNLKAEYCQEVMALVKIVQEGGSLLFLFVLKYNIIFKIL